MNELPTLPKVNDLCDILDKLVKQYHLSYMDAAIHYCEESGLDIDLIGKAIKSNQKIMAKIQTEAETLHFLPKTERLDEFL
jgi:hypothetical protein